MLLELLQEPGPGQGPLVAGHLGLAFDTPPVDRAAGRAQRDLDLRAHPRGAPCPAAHAAHRVEPLVVRPRRRRTLFSTPAVRATRVPLGGRLGRFRAAVRRRARRPAQPSPLQCNFARIWSVPCDVRRHEPAALEDPLAPYLPPAPALGEPPVRSTTADRIVADALGAALESAPGRAVAARRARPRRRDVRAG